MQPIPLATKISFINEIALLSERLDIDIDDIKAELVVIQSVTIFLMLV